MKTEVLIPLNKKSDFEKRLFLERELKELKRKYSQSETKKIIAAKDVEIGKLKSEIDELKDINSKYVGKVYSKMNKTQRKNFKSKFKTELIENQRNQIKKLEEKIKKLKTDNSKLQSEL